MMMPRLMHVPMLHLFLRRFAQCHNLHVEMQFCTRQGMVEIEAYRFTLDAFDTRIAGMTFIVAHG